MIRHRTKCPEHGYAGIGITGPDKRHGTGMPEHLPVAFGALDRGGRGGALERLPSY
jgi:hypothetical protein